MVFEMKLSNGPFESIESGNKKIELRLFDAKRRRIELHDYEVAAKRGKTR